MYSYRIPQHIRYYLNLNITSSATFNVIKEQYKESIENSQPEVSIIIPAYNEEDNIVRTLASLVNNKTRLAIEIIVVNNNSIDKTEEYVKACGINCITEPKQGVANARNAGLYIAKGKYILNADADTIYPPSWIDEMVHPLENSAIAMTYGYFSFIPIGKTTRAIYFFYEHLAEVVRKLNSKVKGEAVNVYGFNSGFRRLNGLSVDGFNHPPGTNEDGWLAMKLQKKGFGKLNHVAKKNAIVWTTDRRIQIDGGLWAASFKRFRRFVLKK